MRLVYACVAPLLVLAACGDNEAQNDQVAMLPPVDEQAAMPAETVIPPAVADAAANQALAEATSGPGQNDPFAGRWIGVEGLYAQITPNSQPGRYTVEMQYTLDDRGTFTALREGDALLMTRNGQRVSITPGNGDETGMKWLAGKRDCLVVIGGSEGYCRD